MQYRCPELDAPCLPPKKAPSNCGVFCLRPPQIHTRTKGEPATPGMRCGGRFRRAISGLWVYFFFPLALAATLAFGAGLGRWTLTLSRSCSRFRSTIPFFQDWETLKPIR